MSELKEGVKPFIIGLTGGIGSGKSAAAQILQGLGAYIIDTDEVSKRVTKDGSECDLRLKTAFPQCVAGGVLQRPLLRNLVFSDESARKRLNSITHPYIISETAARINGKKLVVVQVPLLFESGFDKICDITLCLICDKEIRKKRVKKRDNLSPALIEAIMSTQLSDEELKTRCDFYIDNSGGFKGLEKEVNAFFLKIKERINKHLE